MKIVRIILVALIALSVASLPAAAGVVSAANGNDRPAVDTAAAVGMPTDCDHHAPAGHNRSKGSNDCTSMAACAVSCFNYAGTPVPTVVPAPTTSWVQPIVATRMVVLNSGSPPFRPPRV